MDILAELFFANRAIPQLGTSSHAKPTLACALAGIYGCGI
jgi:hypothetical protein